MNRILNNKNLFLSIVATLLSLLQVITVSAQANVPEIQKQFNKYNGQTLHEKLFVHVDRSFYVAGEILWCKIYCVNDDNNRLSDLSKVAYIEILNSDQQPVLQGKIALNNGTGNGSLVLPSNLYSGNYTFRAYTNWMKNFDPGFYFHQNITIVNTIQADTLQTTVPTEKDDVQFFPEGGELVNDLTSKVGFRVTNQSGKGLDFDGVIVGKNNDTLVRFKPLVHGIGTFNFTPKANEQYKALITTPDGRAIVGDLPAVQPAGYVMNVSEAAGKVKISVQTNTTTKSVYLFIHTRQKAQTAKLVSFSDGKAEVAIDKEKFGDGISHITLFDVNNEPVCERLFFKRPKQQMTIDAVTDEASYYTRKKITVDITTKDENNGIQQGDLSMAVFLMDSVPLVYKDISGYLWLTADLKGTIEAPEYYLDAKSPQAEEALDNLMLTHGWRKFKWSDVLHDKKPALTFLPEYEGHIVSGKVVDRATNAPAETILAFLSIPGSHFKLYNSISAADGSVHFNTRNFYGTRMMVALANAADSTRYRVDLSNPFSERFSVQKAPPFNQRLVPANLLKRSINMQVQNVYYSDRLNAFEPAKTDTVNFYGKPEVTYLLDDYTRFPTMDEVLTEYVPEIGIRKRQDRFSLRMVHKDEDGLPVVNDPVILLDGIPQFDLGNKIAHHDPLKIEKLETIARTYFLGTARFDGIASFFTYKGDLEGFQLDSTSTVLDYEALQLRREFYSPVYEKTEQYVSRMPDYRNLLYWSPDIRTDNTGKKQVSFYTGDLPGKYAVVIQGISEAGKTGSKVFTIEVKKDVLLTR